MMHGCRYTMSALLSLVLVIFWSPSDTTAEPAARLTLKVGGSISPSPGWQDEGGSAINGIAFNFAGKVAGSKANVNIDSSPQKVRLLNAPTYPASVALIRPYGCSIGPVAIEDKYVHFLDNGNAVASNSNISVPNSTLQSYGIRFSAAGHYGNKIGDVSCARSGSLTYTY